MGKAQNSYSVSTEASHNSENLEHNMLKPTCLKRREEGDETKLRGEDGGKVTKQN